jgi:hypothetical protein
LPTGTLPLICVNGITSAFLFWLKNSSDASVVLPKAATVRFCYNILTGTLTFVYENGITLAFLTQQSFVVKKLCSLKRSQVFSELQKANALAGNAMPIWLHMDTHLTRFKSQHS